MSPAWTFARGSLGRRIILLAAVQTALFLLAILLLFRHDGALRARVADATRGFVEEQWTADRLSRAVTLQLMAVNQLHDTDRGEAQFREAGDQAYREIRSYLFRDLSLEQRRRLEAVREAHQRMEVAAAQAIDLRRRGRVQEAEAYSGEMMEGAVALQAQLAAFLRLRQIDLEQLQLAQDRTIRLFHLGGAGFAAILLFSSLALGRYVYRRLATPLVHLAGTAVRAGDGDLTARVPVIEDAELGAVSHGFNRMMERLQEARDGLETRNRELADALDRLRTTQKELVQREKMSAVGAMMAGLAHELNNPLAAVVGYAELLDATLADRDANQTPAEALGPLVAPLVVEGRRARQLVQTLLRFSRKEETILTAVDLEQIVVLVRTLREYAFRSAGLTFVAENLRFHVVADPTRLQQILLNVVNNALDAMRPAGTGVLSIRGRAEGDQVVVTVEDEGPGFRDPARAFEPFYTTKAAGEGTGLGLALTHRFMEEVGGTVAVENRPEGGARITLGFRAAPALAADAERGRASQPSTDADADDLRILVVDDEPHLRSLQRRLLHRLPATVHLAGDVAEARAVLESEPVNMVISDVRMPGGTGLELYRWVQKKRPALADRFLFVTGDVGDPEIAAIAELEPERFILKPFLLDDYLARVGAFARRA